MDARSTLAAGATAARPRITRRAQLVSHTEGDFMRIASAVVFILAFVLQAGPAGAQDQWREFRSESDGFSVQLPQTPTVSARRIGKGEATQTMFLIERG